MKSLQVVPIKTTTFLDQVIEGCILGDGDLKETSASAYFRLGQCARRKDFLDMVASILVDHDVRLKLERDKGNYRIRTPTHKYWKTMRDRFYRDGVKIIPDSYIPSRISLLFLYLSDGNYRSADKIKHYYNMKRSPSASDGVTDLSEWCSIATYGFSFEEIEGLRTRITASIGITGIIYSQRRTGTDKVYGRLVYRGRECRELLSSIYEGKYVPESMEYKFPDWVVADQRSSTMRSEATMELNRLKAMLGRE